MTSPKLLPAGSVVILLIILRHVEHFCVRRTAQPAMALHRSVFLLSLIRNVELLSNSRGEKEFIRFQLFSLLNAKWLFLFLSLPERNV